MTNFNLEWTEEAEELLSVQESASSATRQIYSYDCLLREADSDTPAYLNNLIIYALIPIGCIFFPILIWGAWGLYKRSWVPLRKQYVTTVVILLFMVHPDIATKMYSGFACQEVEDDEFFMLEDMDIE
ncbi:MAG: hypothetical protein V2I33_20900 [Kangiellaceae bacterium]|nr:hypothetical protein [Kangiellaceae bacterium]